MDYSTGWPASNAIENGDPDCIRLYRTSDSTTIDAVQYFTDYGTTPGIPDNALAPANAREGDGTGNGGDNVYYYQLGTAARASRYDAPFGRFPDGADSNNNFADFVNLFQGRSPGTSNNAAYLAPGSVVPEDFGAAVGFRQDWSPSWTTVNRVTAATATPAGMPNSPDATSPANWAAVKDATGGGDQTIMTKFLGEDYNVSCFMYAGPISTITVEGDTEVGALIGRMTAGHQNNESGYYNTSVPVGTYGDSYYAIETDYVTGSTYAVKVHKSTRTILSAGPVLEDPGWYKFELKMVDDQIHFWVNNIRFYVLAGEVERPGYAGIGYNEFDSVSVGTVAANFDDFRIAPGDVSIPTRNVKLDYLEAPSGPGTTFTVVCRVSPADVMPTVSSFEFQLSFDSSKVEWVDAIRYCNGDGDFSADGPTTGTVIGLGLDHHYSMAMYTDIEPATNVTDMFGVVFTQLTANAADIHMGIDDPAWGPMLLDDTFQQIAHVFVNTVPVTVSQFSVD